MNIVGRYYAMRTNERESQLTFDLPNPVETWVAVRGCDPSGTAIADVQIVAHRYGGAFNWYVNCVYEILFSSSSIVAGDLTTLPAQSPVLYCGIRFSPGGEDPPPPPPPSQGPVVTFEMTNVRRIA